jgi:hypothetical protein
MMCWLRVIVDFTLLYLRNAQKHTNTSAAVIKYDSPLAVHSSAAVGKIAQNGHQ